MKMIRSLIPLWVALFCMTASVQARRDASLKMDKAGVSTSEEAMMATVDSGRIYKGYAAAQRALDDLKKDEATAQQSFQAKVTELEQLRMQREEQQKKSQSESLSPQARDEIVGQVRDLEVKMLQLEQEALAFREKAVQDLSRRNQEMLQFYGNKIREGVASVTSELNKERGENVLSCLDVLHPGLFWTNPKRTVDLTERVLEHLNEGDASGSAAKE